MSPDGRTLYHVDTLGGVIFACDLAEDGALDNRREFVRIPNEEGYPDGPVAVTVVGTTAYVLEGQLAAFMRGPNAPATPPPTKPFKATAVQVGKP